MNYLFRDNKIPVEILPVPSLDIQAEQLLHIIAITITNMNSGHHLKT